MSKDRFVGLLFLAFGIYGFVFSINLPMGEWQSPGPGLFPLCVSLLLCLSGVSWLFSKKAGSRVAEVNFSSLRKDAGEPLKVVGITLLFILLMDVVGYMVGASLYLFIILYWVSRYSVWVSSLSAVALGVTSWLFFAMLLGVELPQGPEFFPF